MKLIFFWVLLFMTLLFYSCKKPAAGVVSPPPPPDPTPTVVVDISASITFQTMQGFGSSVRLFDDPHVFNNFDPVTQRAATVLTTAQQNEVLDKLYTDLKFTRARPVIEIDGAESIEPVNDNADPNNTDLTKFNFAWKRNDGYIDHLNRIIPRGVKTYFHSPVKVETWMNETNPAEYVEWAMAILGRWKAQGVEMPYYSIMNEPGYVRSGIWSAAWIRDVIKLLGPKMQAQGMTTKIVIPDDLNPNEAYNRASVILADPLARQYVGALATHLYGGKNLSNLKTLSDQYNIPLWMTEYSTGANGGDAFAYASLMHNLISNYNVSAIDYMWGFFGQWESGKASLVTLNNNGPQYLGYKLEKVYYTVGHFSKFIKEGSKRINTVSSDAGVQVTAYVSGTQTTFVVLNNSSSQQVVKFNLSGLSATQLNAVRTSASENWAALPIVNASATGFVATLPANSITSFFN